MSVTWAEASTTLRVELGRSCKRIRRRMKAVISCKDICKNNESQLQHQVRWGWQWGVTAGPGQWLSSHTWHCCSCAFNPFQFGGLHCKEDIEVTVELEHFQTQAKKIWSTSLVLRAAERAGRGSLEKRTLRKDLSSLYSQLKARWGLFSSHK